MVYAEISRLGKHVVSIITVDMNINGFVKTLRNMRCITTILLINTAMMSLDYVALKSMVVSLVTNVNMVIFLQNIQLVNNTMSKEIAQPTTPNNSTNLTDDANSQMVKRFIF